MLFVLCIFMAVIEPQASYILAKSMFAPKTTKNSWCGQRIIQSTWGCCYFNYLYNFCQNVAKSVFFLAILIILLAHIAWI